MTTSSTKQEGQVLPIAAVALFVIVTFILVSIRLVYLFSADSFLNQRVDFAAAAAARADGDALSSGQIKIDQNRAKAAALAELTGAFHEMHQIGFVRADAQELIAQTDIEFVDPQGACAQFPGDTTCYRVPAVRITATVPFDLFGIPINMTRRSVATLSAYADEDATSGYILQPTPIALPTEVFIAPSD